MRKYRCKSQYLSDVSHVELHKQADLSKNAA